MNQGEEILTRLENNSDMMGPGESCKEWLTAEEAATILRVHVSTIHEMCRKGVLPSIKTGKNWRISVKGLQQREGLDTQHSRMIQEAAALSAELAAQNVLTHLAEVLTKEFSGQRLNHKLSA